MLRYGPWDHLTDSVSTNCVVCYRSRHCNDLNSPPRKHPWSKATLMLWGRGRDLQSQKRRRRWRRDLLGARRASAKKGGAVGGGAARRLMSHFEADLRTARMAARSRRIFFYFIIYFFPSHTLLNLTSLGEEAPRDFLSHIKNDNE